MKTVTEFASFSLKSAATARKAAEEQHVAAGKPPEELAATLTEALKAEGEKLTYLLKALDLIGTRTEDLKRVVVITLNEGEKAPDKAVVEGQTAYVVEHFQRQSQARPEREERGRGGRDGKRGGGGKPGGRDGGRGPGRGGPGGDRPRGPSDAPRAAGGPGGDRPARREPRDAGPPPAPRPPGQPWKITPVGAASAAAPASPSAPAASEPATPESSG